DVQSPGGQSAYDDRQPELALVCDVVAVRMGAEDVRRREPVVADEGEQGLERRTRIHEDRGAALRVADDVGVREVAGIEAAFDEHGPTLVQHREIGLVLHKHSGGSMPGLMSRTMTIIKAKYSKLLNKAENPAETLDYSYEEQLRQLQNVKRGIADVATAKK